MNRALASGLRLLLVLAGVLALAWLESAPLSAQDPQLVAPTDPLSAAGQQKKFHLPPGFAIQLVASEPEIGQPMNLNFDAAGRLWVTHSVEYPYPVQMPGVEPREARFGTPGEHEPRDRLSVFAGIGADGRPREHWDFASGLNIPIGLQPLPDGAIAYGIPHIYRFTDEDGDGRAKRRDVLLTGFGNVDTHGMINGLTRWLDGWIYGCHGFRNTSRVTDGAGHETVMNSGNTYRFRPDGSRFEQWTWGQVNPFGLTFDPLGNIYTADCHSKPLTQLIRGAYYSSFGKPHDGLGFGPNMIDHSHGSTGICGPAYYAAAHFPPEYRENLFLCNPVTGRVHRDRLTWHGSTPQVDTQPDFITCDDPWFRPVDAQVGPDGALYIADFYNCIIGHYEVPLNHPRRDRTHGRIWRVVYTGTDAKQQADIPTPPDLTKLSADELVQRLGDANLVVRTLATNELTDRFGQDALLPVRKMLDGKPSAEQRAHALWVLFRLDTLSEDDLKRFAKDESRLVRTHLAKALAEMPQQWREVQPLLAYPLLADEDPFVRRAAADALARHPDESNVRTLLARLSATDPQDTHLRHALRVALRDQLRDPAVAKAALRDWAEADSRVLAGVAVAVPTPEAAELLAEHLREYTEPQPVFLSYLQHVARHGTPRTLTSLAGAVRRRFADDAARQAEQLTAMHDGLRQRGLTASDELRAWAADLVVQTLDANDEPRLLWSNSPVPNTPGTDDLWTVQQRPCADGKTAAFFSSLPAGEQKTGRYRSAAFELPGRLRFFVAGHRDFPGQKGHEKNAVRLSDADTGAVLREAFPPRNDTAQAVDWDLTDVAGRRGFVEIVDGDTAGAYAWLAVGRFSFEPLSPPPAGTTVDVADLVRRFELTDLAPRLRQTLADESATDANRLRVARALIALEPDARLAALVDAAAEATTPQRVRRDVFAAVLLREAKAIEDATAAVVQTLPQSRQLAWAEAFAADRDGAAALLELVEAGKASPRLLTRASVRQKVAAQGAELEKRIDKLTAGLPSEDAAVAKLIAERLRSFPAETADPVAGRAVFKKHCAACHRIGEDGSLVGPQLDGVGVRGLERILEDVLDPNRNVDAAFRVETLALDDGRVLTGLFRREEGATLVFADEKGQEFTVAAAEIVQRKRSPLSLMPANFGETLTETDLHNLLADLLRQRAAPVEQADAGAPE